MGNFDGYIMQHLSLSLSLSLSVFFIHFCFLKWIRREAAIHLAV